MSTQKIAWTANEESEQITLIAWARLQPILKDFLFAVPNGGYRNKREAAKLKRMGVKAGVSDMFLAYPVFPYHGLWVEFKRGKPSYGVLTKLQKAWLDRMKAVGYATAVAYGFDDGMRVLLDYLYRGEAEK